VRILSNCHILVTGGAGFIGSHLVDSLLDDHYRVTVIDNFDSYYSKQIKMRNIQAHLRRSNYRFYESDICNENDMNEIFKTEKPDIVVHLAAKAGVRPSVDNPLSYMTANVTGTANILNCSRKNGVRRVIFGSSSSVYGLNSKVPFSERDPILSPASPYGATKIAGEALCHSYSNCYGLPIVALRFFTVYGPRQRPDLAIHKFSRHILQGIPIPLYGNGETSRDYTFVSDIVTGIRLAIEHEWQGYDVFNLGNDKPVKLIDLVRSLERALNKKATIEWHEDQIGDVPITWADLSKSEKILGYRPKIGLEKGLELFAEWIRKYEFNE